MSDNQPTKQPFSSTNEETKPAGKNTILNVVAIPFAAVGGAISQITQKFTRKEK